MSRVGLVAIEIESRNLNERAPTREADKRARHAALVLGDELNRSYVLPRAEHSEVGCRDDRQARERHLEVARREKDATQVASRNYVVDGSLDGSSIVGCAVALRAVVAITSSMAAWMAAVSSVAPSPFAP